MKSIHETVCVFQLCHQLRKNKTLISLVETKNDDCRVRWDPWDEPCRAAGHVKACDRANPVSEAIHQNHVKWSHACTEDDDVDDVLFIYGFITEWKFQLAFRSTLWISIHSSFPKEWRKKKIEQKNCHATNISINREYAIEFIISAIFILKIFYSCSSGTERERESEAKQNYWFKWTSSLSCNQFDNNLFLPNIQKSFSHHHLWHNEQQ